MRRERLELKKVRHIWTEAEVKDHQQRHGFKPPQMPQDRSGDKSAVLSQPDGERATGLGKRSKAGGKLRLSRQPNKTEAEFGLILEVRRRKGEFRTVEFECVTLRVGDGAKYTPDWFCEPEGWGLVGGDLDAAFDGRLRFFEIKGPQKWDDAIAKFKSAVDRYGRWARFEMWDKIDGHWRQIA